MSETRETPDPWKKVFATAIEGGWSVYYADEVNAARAAVERQHAESMAAKDAELDTLWEQKSQLEADNRVMNHTNHGLNADLRTLREQLAAAQRFKDAVAQALAVENPDGPVSDEAIVAAAEATLSQLLDLSSPSTPEPSPATVCEWRPYEFRNGNYYALVGTCCETAEGLPMLRRAVKKWKCCPYCGKSLVLVPAEEPTK